MTTASTSATGPKASTAGIVERADTQQRVIPESRRADGSIRKERKVRPGFTPVEDVVRYRPTRAREAEEARKRVAPGSAPTATAVQSAIASSSRTSNSSGPSALQKLDTDRLAWRSNTRTAPAASHASERTPDLRANSVSNEKVRRQETEADAADKPGASSSAAKPWQNSRLRKALPSQQKQEKAATVSDAWDQEETSQGKESVRTQTSRMHASADELAAELDSLSINSSKASREG